MKVLDFPRDPLIPRGSLPAVAFVTELQPSLGL